MYNYRSNVPGHRKLSTVDRFVYYSPGEHIILDGGTINEIETIGFGYEGGTLTEHYDHFDHYHKMDLLISVRDIKH